MWFSSKTKGFYSADIHGENMPSDAVEISQEAYLALLLGQSNGMAITADSDGQPILAEQPPPSPELLLANAEALRDKNLSMAALRIAPLQDAVDLNDATPGDVALLEKWKRYRVSINRLDLAVQPITWPDKPAE